MSVGNDDSGGLSAECVEIMRKLMETAAAAEGEDDALASAAQLAQLLFAQIATANIDPSALRVILESETHPLLVRRFAAVDVNGHRQSWTRQEERVLNRYASAQARLRDAKAIAEAADLKLQHAKRELESVSIEMALMRLSVMLRGLQEFVRPALETGPLVMLMLAVLGDPAAGDDAASEDARTSARRTFEVLARRIEDEDFKEKVGALIRDFVTTYDDEVGGERRLSAGAAERSRNALLADGKAMRKLREAASGEAGDASPDDVEAASGDSASAADTDIEDEFEGLPF